MSKKRQIEELIGEIVYNFPLSDGIAVTMGPCKNQCGQSARGGGLCPVCAMHELSALTGEPSLVYEFVKNLQRNKDLYAKILKNSEDALSYPQYV